MGLQSNGQFCIDKGSSESQKARKQCEKITNLTEQNDPNTVQPQVSELVGNKQKSLDSQGYLLTYTFMHGQGEMFK